MRLFGDWTIRRRLMFLMMVSSCATLFVVSVAWLTYDRSSTRDTMIRELSTMGEIVGNAASAAIDLGILGEMEESLLILSQRPGVLRSALYSREGEVLVSYSGTGAKKGLLPLIDGGEGWVAGEDDLAVFVPIVEDGVRIGTIGIESNYEAMRRRQAGFVGVLAIVLVICLALAFGLAFKLQEVISGPIVLLTGTMRAVSEHKDYSLRARKSVNDEVGFLTDAFNEMLATIQDRDAELERHRNSLEDEVSQRTRELQRKNEQLQVSAAEAQAAAVAKSQFLANMSHEIRTPLNGILGLNAMLLDTELNDEQRNHAELVGSSAKVLLDILNDILDFSKIEAGKLELESICFDLFQVVEEVVRLLSGSVRERGLQMTCWLDPSIPTALLGDPTRVRQIITNLVGNAVKFTEDGQISVRVERTAISEEDVVVRVSVTDTGIGIEPEKRERLFESFSQADASTTRRYGGTGLGLAICQQLVEMMGGEIGVESHLGEGSTFWFAVPFERASDAVGRRGLPEGLRCPTVLVADGSVAVREAILQQLDGWGVGCRVAMDLDGVEAAFAEENAEADFGILLIGEELLADGRLERLERLREREGVRVVVMSWNARNEELPSGAEPDAVMEKPIRPSALLNGILSVLDEGAGAVERAPSRTFPARLAKDGDLRILLVEDNRVNQLVARRILEKGGYTCTTVSDGIEAVRETAANEYDVVLMDCQMPGMDGFEATRAIRERERAGVARHRAHIVALTANALSQDRQRCLESGMDDYLSKPVAPETLLEKLAELNPNTPPPRVRPDGGEPLARTAFLSNVGSLSEIERTATDFGVRGGRALATLRTAVRDGDVGTAQEALAELREVLEGVPASSLHCLAEFLEQRLAAGAVQEERTRTALAELAEELDRCRVALEGLAQHRQAG